MRPNDPLFFMISDEDDEFDIVDIRNPPTASKSAEIGMNCDIAWPWSWSLCRRSSSAILSCNVFMREFCCAIVESWPESLECNEELVSFTVFGLVGLDMYPESCDARLAPRVRA